VPRKKTKNQYFGRELDFAIDYYCRCENSWEKEKIYYKTIFPALKTLCQNVFFNRKICYYDSTPSDAIHDCVVFITERLDKYDISKNTNSFSYFNRAAINFFIQMSQKHYSATLTKEKITTVDRTRDLQYEQNREEYTNDLSEFFNLWVPYMYDNVDKLFNSKEQSIAEAVLICFRDRHNFDTFDKKQLYIFIREMSKQPTSSITPVVKKIYQYYTLMYQEWKDVFYNFDTTLWDDVLNERLEYV
jgi:hypothetical protein